jgi:hypothetical protein
MLLMDEFTRVFIKYDRGCQPYPRHDFLSSQDEQLGRKRVCTCVRLLELAVFEQGIHVEKSVV